MNSGLVVSDLHIFSPSSCWEAALKLTLDLITSANTVVLNGDIFDFKRSSFRTSLETNQQAIQLIEPILQKNPQIHFHYVIGNHDAVTVFLQSLRDLANRQHNLSIHYSHVVLGKNLFLHGDVCHSEMGIEELKRARSRYSDIEPDDVSTKLSELIVLLRANLIAYLTHPKATMCKRIIHYLERAAPADLAVVDKIYFGHTHVSFETFTCEGKQFCNTGGAVKNLRFFPARFEY